MEKMYIEEGYFKNSDGKWEIILNHYLPNISPDMLWWWFNNIDTKRYKLYKPETHKSFHWIVAPQNKLQQVSAVFCVRQKMQRIPFSIPLTFFGRGEVLNEFVNEYRCEIRLLVFNRFFSVGCDLQWGAHDTGTNLKVKYILSGYLPEFLVISIYDNDLGLQQRLNEFLPGEYNQRDMTK